MENNEMNVQNNETIEPVVKQKSNKGLIVLIIILILMVLGLSGYLVHDKFIEKDTAPKTVEKKDNTVDNKTNEDKTIEYVSIDGIEYLKLKEDNTYELNVSTGVTGNNLTKNGNYTKENDNTYLLDSGNKVEIKAGYVEITKMETEGFIFVNVVLFDKNKLNDIKTKIDSNVATYVEGLRKSYPNAAEIEKVETKINGSCFRYAMQETDSNQEYVKCSIRYDIYLNGYNQTECKKEINNSSELNNSKYIGYMIPAGECEENYVLSGKFFTLDQNNDYKILDTFTGL